MGKQAGRGVVIEAVSRRGRRRRKRRDSWRGKDKVNG